MMVAEANIDAAADRLWQAWCQGRACAPVRDLIGDVDVDVAYEVQRRNERRMVDNGERVVGRKIGLTATAVQQQLGVEQPDFGPLFASCRIDHDGVVDLAPLIAPRIEAEIALVLEDWLDDPAMRHEDIRRATRHVVAAIEVVDSRVADWDIMITDTIADFASGAGFVLGPTPRPLEDLDLTTVPMIMRRDGEEVCSGTGAASMGDPLEATLWLARTLAERGAPLGPGDIVLSGALGPFVEVEAGQDVRADLGPLGSVSVGITRRSA